METSKALNSQSNLYQRNKDGGITVADFMTYCRAVVTKTARYWNKDRNTGQWNIIGT